MFSFCFHVKEPDDGQLPRSAFSSDCASRRLPRHRGFQSLPPGERPAPELDNPNLHDVANMNFRVELWDQHARHIRWVVAAAGTVKIAHVVFETGRTTGSRSAAESCSSASIRRSDEVRFMRVSVKPKGAKIRFA
jgi:hypothetical protein